MSVEVQAAGESQAATAEACPAPIIKNEDPHFAFVKATITSMRMALCWQRDALRALQPEDVAQLKTELRALYSDLSNAGDDLATKIVPEEVRTWDASHGRCWFKAYQAWKTEDEARGLAN